MSWYKEKAEQSDLQKLVCTAKDFTPEPNQSSKEIFFSRGGTFAIIEIKLGFKEFFGHHKKNPQKSKVSYFEHLTKSPNEESRENG